jgi:hypothetical protein
MTRSPDAAEPTVAGGDSDPIRQRREKIRRLVSMANRLGYLLLAAAIVVFFVALATDFSPTMAAIIVGTFVASCVLLAPSIVLGYAVKAADRDDRERGL